MREYGGIMVCDYSDGTLEPKYESMETFAPPTDSAWRIVGFGYELTNTTP